MSEKKSFIMYRSYEETFFALSNEEAGQLIKLIFSHGGTHEPPEASRTVELLFGQIRDTLDRDAASYEATCRRRSEYAKRRWAERGESANPVSNSVCMHKHSDNKDDDVNDDEDERENENANAYVNGKVNENENENEEVSPTEPHPDETNKKYGKHVMLTPSQFRELGKEYGFAALWDYIRRVDSYIMKSKKKPFSNHYTTLSNWLKEDIEPLRLKYPYAGNSDIADEYLKLNGIEQNE